MYQQRPVSANGKLRVCLGLVHKLHVNRCIYVTPRVQIETDCDPLLLLFCHSRAAAPVLSHARFAN